MSQKLNYKLAIFDMDGTILDTLDDLTGAINFGLKSCNMPERTRDEIRQFVGNGIKKAVQLAVPQNTSDDDVEKVLQFFGPYYKVHSADRTKPYNGIVELIHKLRNAGVKTAVVSNKVDFAVQDLCKTYFDGCFDFAVGEREGIQRKPSPDSVNEVLKTLKISRDDAVYIGDSEVDFQTAVNAQMNEIAVTWGFRDVDFLKKAGATNLADTPQQVFDLIVTRGI